jgi:polymorphic toxin system nucleotidyltransferase-like protein
MKLPVRDASTDEFAAALDALLPQLQSDSAILAALLGGSLSHDRVWAKSDIDLLLVTTDDKLTGERYISLNAGGVNVHALLMQRAEFRKLAEGAVHQSFMHSFLAKSRVLFTRDETIPALCARLHRIGDRDTSMALLDAGLGALPCLYKAHKFLLTRGDLDYTALWILYAATSLAKIEIISARKLVDREVIPQALALNPSFFRIVYTDLLNTKKTKKFVERALAAADNYVAARAPRLFAAVLDYLREAGEIRSASDLESHFQRSFGISGVTTACEYLADQGVLVKASSPVRATKRSSASLQELAFFLPHGS